MERPVKMRLAGDWDAKAPAVASPRLLGDTPVTMMFLPWMAFGKAAAISVAGLRGPKEGVGAIFSPSDAGLGEWIE